MGPRRRRSSNSTLNCWHACLKIGRPEEITNSTASSFYFYVNFLRSGI